jgi:hypothetical protein
MDSRRVPSEFNLGAALRYVGRLSQALSTGFHFISFALSHAQRMVFHACDSAGGSSHEVSLTSARGMKVLISTSFNWRQTCFSTLHLM